MIQKFENIQSLYGVLKLSGDKSISHRAVMFGSLANGKSVIKNCSEAEDVLSTIRCFEKMGVLFESESDKLIIHGKGFNGLSKPSEDLYAGNSGTTARLITGILAAQEFDSVLTGDESLSARPMKRVVEPLRKMGADISTSDKGSLPLKIKPVKNLLPVDYEMEVASAQVKSALVLAAIHVENESCIIEKSFTRNHTECMLDLRTEFINGAKKIYVSQKDYPRPFEMTIPSDISSAAFFIVLTLLSKNSEVVIKNITLNETRTGVLNVLKLMGGRIIFENEREEGGERRGDIRVFSSTMNDCVIPLDIIPNIIDEIPILSVAGIMANDHFRINGAAELRVKESDRIKSLCHNYNLMGLEVTEYDDGFEVKGRIPNEIFTFESFGDHRIAMSFAVLSMLNKKGGLVNGFECVAISNPSFLNQIKKLI